MLAGHCFAALGPLYSHLNMIGLYWGRFVVRTSDTLQDQAKLCVADLKEPGKKDDVC